LSGSQSETRNLAALRGDLKDDAPTVCADAAVRGNTISITGFVENQAAATRIRSGVALKDMQEALGPASVHVWCELEDRAATSPTLAGQVAAVCGRAVKISYSDCTTGTVSLATGVGFTMSIVVTDGGQEIKYVGANTGNINSGTLRLMAASCSASILSGNSYGYATNGLIGAGGSNSFPRVGGFVPFAHAGRISLGAAGSISGVDNASFGGVLMPGQPIAGTYSVNSDCTGTTTMTIAGVDTSWHFVILQDVGQIIFVASPTGARQREVVQKSASRRLPLISSKPVSG
jgi:hypothetical protein